MNNLKKARSEDVWGEYGDLVCEPCKARWTEITTPFVAKINEGRFGVVDGVRLKIKLNNATCASCMTKLVKRVQQNARIR